MALHTLTDPAPREDTPTRAQLDGWRDAAPEPSPLWTTPHQTPPVVVPVDDVVLVVALPARVMAKLEHDAERDGVDVHAWCRLLLVGLNAARDGADAA